MTILKTNKLAGPGGTNAIGGSVAFTSSTGYLSTTLDVIGDDDFTIEWWFKATDMTEPGTANRRMFRLGANNATGSMSINYDAVNNDIQWNYDAATILAASTIKIYDNSWYHIAAVREGTGTNETKLYINGVLSDSVTLPTNFTQTALQIGWDSTLGDDFGFYGNISNLRVTKGAIYSAAFTPPTEQLTTVPGIFLLCCQDSDDPTQEATGKTITGYGGLASVTTTDNLITNGNFDTSATDGWTVASGSAALGTGQSGTFGDGNHLVMSGGNMYQAFTTVIGRTYFVNCQSNGSDTSRISTSTSTGDAIITDIRSTPQTGNGVRGQKSFVATQTTYYVILTGGGDGNFDTVSVYEAESPKAPKDFPSVGTDAGTVLEGDITFDSLNYMTLPKGTTQERGRGTRGVFYTGGGSSNAIDYINIQTTANATDFGDLQATYGANAGCSSNTRGIIFAGFLAPAETNAIEYITIATTGNSADFGDLTQGRRNLDGFSSQTRGIAAGGTTQSPAVRQNVIDYITIATTGDATDFGDLQNPVSSDPTGFSSPTRGIVAGGEGNSPLNNGINVIDYVTIASTGNAQDFGDLTTVQARGGGTSSNIRGVIYSGKRHPTSYSNTIDYITIATTGNAQDFGDAETAINNIAATSNCLRGVFGGGYVPGANTNAISYMSLQSSGNSLTFGDLTYARREFGACSDSHGGLS